MGFGYLLPVATRNHKIGKTFMLVHVNVSGGGVGILEPDFCGDFFLEGCLVGFAG